MADEERPQQSPFIMTEAIPKFSGDDLTYSSTKWGEDINDNAEIFGWTAQQKLIIARRSLTGTAELWLRTEKTFRTFDELRAALQREFPDSINSKQMHETMSARRKKITETCYQYMLIMKELGRRAKFPDYVSIQYIVDGIPDSQVNKMCLYGVTTYAALKEKLAIYEAMKQKMKPVPDNLARRSDLNGKKTTSNSDNHKNTAQRCFKCGEIGHLASACSSGIKCFRCNAFGHIGSECQAGGVNGGGMSTGRNVGSMNAGNGTRTRRSMFIEDQSIDSVGAVNEGERERFAEANEVSQT